MSQSENCCCDESPCDSGKVGACCYEPDASDPSGCALLTECECRKKNGVWRGENTTCPNACYQCVCCGTFETDADGVPGDFKGNYKKAHIRSRNPCGAGEITRGYRPTNSSGGCVGNCDQPCEQPGDPTGVCCFNCGCVTGVTACTCRKLTAGRGKCTQYGNNFVQGATSCQQCAICACLNGTLQDLQSRECCDVNAASFIAYEGSCNAAEQAFGSGYIATASQICRALAGMGGGGGGGGGGTGFGTPITPSIPQQTTRPCNTSANLTPSCLVRVWFWLESTITEDCTYRQEYYRLVTGLATDSDRCDTLGSVGVRKNCDDESILRDVFKTVGRVLDCTFGNTDWTDSRIDLTCNSPQETYRYENLVCPCPSTQVTTQELRCFDSRKLRSCCDTKMNSVTIRVPELGTRENGIWASDYTAAYTLVIDLKNLTCVGYDRQHRSCK